MTDPTRQLLEDRAMRDAGRGLVQSDISFIRESVAARSVPARLLDRVSGGARDIADEAAVVAEENRKVLAASVALGTLGLVGWIFRDRLQALFHDLLAQAGIGSKSGEPEPARTRFENKLRTILRRPA